MSEKNPEKKKKQKGFRIEFEDGTEFLCTPDSTHAFIHSEEPDGDHLFIYKYIEGQKEPVGHFVFREQIANFDSIVMFMDANDFNVMEDARLTEGDRKAYEEFKERQRIARMTKDDIHWISPRQELTNKRAVEFLIYLAQNGKL